MKTRVRFDKNYVTSYINSQPRYTSRYTRRIFPQRTYPDPIYPDKVVIVELPFHIPFKIEQVFWDASRLSHKLPVFQSDFVGFFAALTAGDAEGKSLFSIIFTGEDVFLLFRKWLCFVSPHGENLIKSYYQKNTLPHVEGYERQVVRYADGLLYADHFNLRKIMSGITIE